MTEPGYLGSPVVFIDGVAAYCDICTVDGLHVAPSGSGSTIRGLAIGNFSGDGIELEGNDAGSVIESSWIGIDPTPSSGGYAGNGGSGIRISSSSGNRDRRHELGAARRARGQHRLVRRLSDRDHGRVFERQHGRRLVHRRWSERQ